MEAQAHARGVAFGAEWPRREPLAHRLEPVPRQAQTGLPGLARVERDLERAAPAGETRCGMAREPFRRRRPPRHPTPRRCRTRSVHESLLSPVPRLTVWPG